MFVDSLALDWDMVPENSYLRTIGSLKTLSRLDFSSSVTFFVGENGSGKSTLLEAMAVASGFNPEGGTRNYSFSTRDSHSLLCDAIRLEKGIERPRWGYFLRAESFYNVATAEEGYFEKWESQRLHEKSHGESFLSALEKNLNPRGLYFFDEPESALSPQRQLTLLLEIYRHAEEGAQFFIVTHSPILLGIPGASILSFGEDGIHQVEYEETESYRVTSMFLSNRERVLRNLLSED